MISFPNCKINLGLRILDKRMDGYHNIQSIFYPVNWCDAVEIIHHSGFFFEGTGIQFSSLAGTNLCEKAYRLLQEKHDLPGIKMFLLKNIPVGAGLGGGSADAAFTLKMLNEFFSLDLSRGELSQYATDLGSDCPFFIENTCCLVTGRGESMIPLSIDLAGYYIAIVYPGIAVNTAWAYSEIDKKRQSDPMNEQDQVDPGKIINSSPATWRDILKNDFEPIVFPQYPEIEMIKTRLNNSGALYSSMSGSGSAVFGIFKDIPEISFEDKYRVFKSRL
jgi:4-diphosphocytidyl-2-C-methyl-D-erythritol kinase